MKRIEIILYVANQENSKNFYTALFKEKPILDVPGMTSFQLTENTYLGLMPETGIAKILQNKIDNPASGNGIPRCELYLYSDNIVADYENAISCNAKLISPIMDRDWGDKVCYFADHDGHIIAFAQKL